MSRHTKFTEDPSRVRLVVMLAHGLSGAQSAFFPVKPSPLTSLSNHRPPHPQAMNVMATDNEVTNPHLYSLGHAVVLALAPP